MDFREIVLLPKWTPFSRVVKSVSSDRLLGQCLYRLEKDIYLCSSIFKGPTLETSPPETFLTGVLWAVDEGAARRAVLYDIEADCGFQTEAPRDFLPEGALPIYRDILESLQQRDHKIYPEIAVYRAATDGRLVHRMIETKREAFYFRSADRSDLESPYAVVRKLRGIVTSKE